MSNFNIAELTEKLTAVLSGQGKDFGDANPVNSRFYQQVMKDGNVFNPYIHRRFLPAHYERYVKNSSNVRNYYNSNYYLTRKIMKYFINEAEKLSYLEIHNKFAFKERKEFFPLELYQQAINKVIYLSSYYFRNKSIPVIDSYKAAYTWMRDHVRFMMSLVSWYDGREVKNDIVAAYNKAGAYYTIKHYLMFSSQPIKDINNYTDLYYKLITGSSDIYFENIVREIIKNKTQNDNLTSSPIKEWVI